MTTDKFRVAISGDFRQPDGSATFPDFDLGPIMSAPGVDVCFLEDTDPIKAEQVAGCDALILLAARFTRDSIPPDGRLALVARFGVGYDTVDVAACTDSGIAVALTPEGTRRPVAMSIITLMLALTGRLLVKDRLTRQAAAGFARRDNYMGVGLVGRTLGSLGVGNIGAELFRLAKPFGMNFIAHDPFVDTAMARELGIELVPIEELFAQADVVSINCPLNEKTHHIVDADLLRRMKPTAFLINTARGGLVDQKALTLALREGSIAGAGLDVLELEPPDADDPILSLENVILSPHALSWTDQSFADTGAADVQAALDVQHGQSPRVVANPAVLTTDIWKRRLADYRSRFGAPAGSAGGA